MQATVTSSPCENCECRDVCLRYSEIGFPVGDSTSGTKEVVQVFPGQVAAIGLVLF